MYRAAGVIHTEASAEVAHHEFQEVEIPVISTGYGDETYSTTHIQPLSWEAAEQLYKDLAKIFGERN